LRTAWKEDLTDPSDVARTLSTLRSTEMKPFLESLRTMAWRTAGARYNAARRLRQREIFSTFSLALFSSLTIAVAFAQRIYMPLPGTTLDSYLTALSVCLGVFLLAISLMEWGAAHALKAEALHRNAEELTAFQIKLRQVLAQMESGTPIADDRVDLLRLEYETIKGRCAHNHEPIDHAMFSVQQRTALEFAAKGGAPAIGVWEARYVTAKWHMSAVWYFIVFWGLILGALGFAVCLPA
jgi:hypothetical protein